jgi:hypothetical protein
MFSQQKMGNYCVYSSADQRQQKCHMFCRQTVFYVDERGGGAKKYAVEQRGSVIIIIIIIIQGITGPELK